MKTQFILTTLIFILFLNLALAEELDKNLTDEEKAYNCINESKEIINNLIENNFTTKRVNDSLKEAVELLERDKFLKEENRKYDFSKVLPFCTEIKKISTDAFNSRDELTALEKFYKEFLSDTKNTTSIDIIIQEIKTEINNERYEKVSPLIEKGYTEIVNIKSSETTLNLIYKTTTRGIKDFFKENYKIILFFLVALIIILIIYQKAIRIWWIKQRISSLELRRSTLKKLIMKTQKDYFEKGELSEGIYEIKTKKFAELIRDIDRQIPLLKENLVKLGDGYKSLQNYKDEITKSADKLKRRIKKKK